MKSLIAVVALFCTLSAHAAVGPSVTPGGNNTFTGTNTFTGLISAPQYAFERIIFAGPPNTLTNVTGLYGSSQLVHTVTIPGGIMGTNGVLLIGYDVQLFGTIGAAGTTRGFTLHHNTTNDLARFQFASASTATTNQFTTSPTLVLKNVMGATNNVASLNQVEGGAKQNGSGRSAWVMGSTTQSGEPNVDTAADWTLSLYANSGNTGETNIYKRLVISVIQR